MNTEAFRRRADTVYERLMTSVVDRLLPFLGRSTAPETVAEIVRASGPVIRRARTLAQNQAYSDYVRVIERKDPIPKALLTRFTDEAWTGSVTKALGEEQSVTVRHVEDAAMAADWWARDAERGQRVHSAQNDPRVSRLARVDRNPPSCPWCTLLNSRGPVYHTEKTGNATFHKGDECELVLVKVGAEDWPGKQEADKALKIYRQAVDELGGSTERDAVIAKIREIQKGGESVSSRVRQRARSAATKGGAEALARFERQRARVQAQIDTAASLRSVDESARAHRDALVGRLTRRRDDLDKQIKQLQSA